MSAESFLKINILKPVRTPEGLMFWSACLLVVSMVVSPFLLSVSMWGLAGAALWHTAAGMRARGELSTLRSAGSWWAAVLRSFRNLWENRPLALMTLLLLVPAFSIFWSDDWAYWLRVTRVRLPFLILPWTFANLPRLGERERNEVLYLLVWFMVLMCIGVGINFLLHYDAVITGLGRGQPVPVPRQHVRFSLVLAMAIIAGGWLWRRGFVFKHQWERPALACAVVFLFLFIHILSVRGGLAVLYAALIFSIFWFVGSTRRWGLGLATLASLFLMFWIASSSLPSLRTRLAYMKYDWERYKANDGEAYSDAERWISLKVGWKIWQKHPMFGTGAGDLLTEVNTVTVRDYPDYAKFPKLPHNQWLHIMASTGLLGLLLSIAGFAGPFLASGNRRSYLFLTFQLMAFLTFILECTVENAIGVSWFLFYTLWLMGIEGTAMKKSGE